MDFVIRTATAPDAPALAELIAASVRGLARAEYDERQIEASIATVFGVDMDLIADGTYFAVESPDGELAGCGGWSKRKTLYGASGYESSRDPELLDPRTDAAKIRAFFVHPAFARMGVGTLILGHCERAAVAAGFKTAEMMATLPGVKLYEVRGYSGNEKHRVSVGDGLEIICVKMRKVLKPL